jgi:hypothetical protein
MMMFTVNNTTYFRDANYENNKFFIRADQKVQYDQEAMAQKNGLSKTSKKATSKEIMEAEARDRQLRTKIHGVICKRQAEDHVEFHLAAMYRTKAHKTSGLVARLRAERDGLNHDERERFLKKESRKAGERFRTLETLGTDLLERIYERAIIVDRAIHNHHCIHENG